MDWVGWAVFGLVSTVALTGIMTLGQMTGRSRMDLPFMLGVGFVEDPDHARAIGSIIHLVNGQIFALMYAAAFSLLGVAAWWLGAFFGLCHGLAAFAVIVPLLAGVNPRIASDRAPLGTRAVLEPPGFLGLRYGTATPAIGVLAHVVYGAMLGALLHP